VTDDGWLGGAYGFTPALAGWRIFVEDESRCPCCLKPGAIFLPPVLIAHDTGPTCAKSMTEGSGGPHTTLPAIRRSYRASSLKEVSKQ
jgi:hypothetical protein